MTYIRHDHKRNVCLSCCVIRHHAEYKQTVHIELTVSLSLSPPSTGQQLKINLTV